MNDSEALTKVLEKLQSYSLWQPDWVAKKKIKVMHFEKRHVLIEYCSGFELQFWMQLLLTSKKFDSFEPKWWVRRWKNEYDNPLREAVLRQSLHLTHDGNLKLSAHIDSWNPQQNGLMHLICDVILRWS